MIPVYAHCLEGWQLADSTTFRLNLMVNWHFNAYVKLFANY